MKLKNKKRLLNELSKEATNPKEFIYAVMALQQQSAEDVVKNVDMTSAHFYVAKRGRYSKSSGNIINQQYNKVGIC